MNIYINKVFFFFKKKKSFQFNLYLLKGEKGDKISIYEKINLFK